MAKDQSAELLKTFEDSVTEFGKAVKNINKAEHNKILNELQVSRRTTVDYYDKLCKRNDFVAVDKEIKTESKVISESINLSKMDNIISNIEGALNMVKDQSVVDNAGKDKFDEIRKNLNSVKEAVNNLKSNMNDFDEKLKDISG